MGAIGDANDMERAVSELQHPLLTSTRDEPPKHATKRGHRGKHRSHHRSTTEAPPSVAFAIIATLVVALGPLTMGFSLGYTSPTQSAMTEDLHLTVSEFSTFGSILNVGAMLGAIASGRVADTLGRKGALMVALVPEMVGWLLIVLAHTPIKLIIARVLVGFGVGIISFTVPMYIGEIAPRHLRGRLGTAHQLAVTIGVLLAYLCGIFVNWRTLAVLGALPELVLAIGLLFIPESPRWLAKVGRKEELSSSLQKLRGKDHDISNEIMEIQAVVEASFSIPSVRWIDLMHRKLLRPLIAGVGLMVLQQFSGVNAVMLYSSHIFSTAGVSNPSVASLALASLQLAMTFVAAGLMDKAGRRILLMVSAGGMALTSFLVGLSFYLRGLDHMSSSMDIFIRMLALISLLVYTAAFSLGMGAIPWIIMSEIFPAHVKGMAGSFATLVNWLCSYAVTMVFNSLLLWSSAGSFWMFGAECLATVVFVMLYVPETRGRTLEQIEASFG